MDSLAAWNLLNESLHADCVVFKVYRQRFQHPLDQREGDFFTIRSLDWVLTLPVTSDRRLLLVRQFRFGTRHFSWEPPGGLMESGESPEQAGARELEEETGYTSQRIRSIGSCAPNPAIFNNTAHFVLAEDCTPSGQIQFDVNEEVESRLFSVHEVDAMLHNGELQHVIAQAAFFHLRLARPDLWQG
ncbi:MAG: NUDIX hydrolase [Puniceicoccales bacterium]|jgi:8-oxo-dGTP pyrophosphatase MutT (NUDIX family)|nr:NUDIX hydrolase [Puniceicoccales bacterium]